MQLESKAADLYVVYQMGKVGSSTVHQSLHAAGVAPLYKIHYLSDLGYARAQAFYERHGPSVGLPHEEATRHLRNLLGSGGSQTWKVISLVREPIARDVSAFLQMADLIGPRSSRSEPGKDDIAKVARACTAQFYGFTEGRSYTARWFDEEIRESTGVDVFTQRFDPVERCLRIREGNVDLLVLRMEDLDVIGPALLRDFVGRPVPLRRRSSRTPEKLQTYYVNQIYQQVVERISLEPALCERIYRTRYARHFYSADELTAFARRWSRSPAMDERGPS